MKRLYLSKAITKTYSLKKLELHSEIELVTRLINQDHFAFEVLFYKYKNKVKGFVLKFAPSQIDADDIVQKVFIKVWLQKEKLSIDKSFSAFLYTIAKNEIIDQLKSSVNRRIYFMGNNLIADLNIREQSDNTDEQLGLEKKITELIHQLPERRKEIFELSRFGGLTYRQIAEKLEISENTVDTQIRKALKFLREKLKIVRNNILLIIF